MKMSHERFTAMLDKIVDECKGSNDPEILTYIKGVNTIRRNGVDFFNHNMTMFIMEQMLREYITGVPLLDEWNRSMVVRGFICDGWHDAVKSAVGGTPYFDNDTSIGEVVWECWASFPLLMEKWNNFD